jgi:CBS domain-containing membrane protein
VLSQAIFLSSQGFPLFSCIQALTTLRGQKMKRKIKRGLRISRYVVYKETLIDHREHFSSFVGSLMGIGIIAFIQNHFLEANDNLFLIGSFGASSVLVYGVIQSPMAQPRNLIGGHFISAMVGVTIAQLLPDIIWITAPLAVAQSIVLMQVTKTLHPPGGATALIAVIGSEKIKDLGFWYVLSPVVSGCLILFATALIFNNITANRQYPNTGTLAKKIKKHLHIR